MKQINVLIIALCILALAGCAPGPPSPTEVEDFEEGSSDVIITVPASAVDQGDIEATIAGARAQGIRKVVLNDDGSLTYTMSRAAHNKMMQGLRENFIRNVEDMKSGGDFASIKDVQYNKELTLLTLIVDRELYENSMDAFAVFGLGMAAMYYQLFDGVKADHVAVTVEVRDLSTGEIMSHVVYPDDLAGVGSSISLGDGSF